MRGLLKFPWIYVTEFLLWCLFACAGVFLASFALSVPIAELDLGVKSLPSDWEAAYPNHGNYVRGYLVSRHPFWFGLLVLVITLTCTTMWLVSVEIKRQVKAGGPSRERTHKIAQALFVVALFALGLLAMKTVLVGVVPT
jgi:hypothetical protein